MATLQVQIDTINNNLSGITSIIDYNDPEVEIEKIIYNNKLDIIFLEVYVQEFLS